MEVGCKSSLDYLEDRNIEILQTEACRRDHKDETEYENLECTMWPLQKVVGPSRIPFPIKFGGPQIEVFSLRVNKINNGGRHIYCTFMLDCNVCVECMYKDEKPDANDEAKESSSAAEGDELQLIGPNESSIHASDRLSFHLRLMNETSIPCVGLVAWDPEKKYLYNVPLYGTIEGQFGSVTVNYAVFTKPISAKVQVVLLDDTTSNEEDSSPPYKRAKMTNSGANIYGRISARNSFFESAEDRSVLFNRKKTSSLHVDHGQDIPLSRSIVSFPYPASLIIEVDLWAGDDKSSVPIAQGRVELAEPEFGSTTGMNIFPNIQLNVTWARFFFKGHAYGGGKKN